MSIVRWMNEFFLISKEDQEEEQLATSEYELFYGFYAFVFVIYFGIKIIAG
jgi:hypothetical protein